MRLNIFNWFSIYYLTNNINRIFDQIKIIVSIKMESEKKLKIGIIGSGPCGMSLMIELKKCE